MLAGVDNAMTVAQEEIFGPVVTVIPFEDEKDAIRIANDVRYGLFATVWTGDPARGHRVARAIKSGMVGINMPFTAFPGIPFGGYKQSGFGRELSIDTLDLYLETKGVLFSTSPKPFNPVRALSATGRTIVFFPEGAFGPTNNCVGIGDVLRRPRPPGRLRHRGVVRRHARGEGLRGAADAARPAAAEPEEPGQFWKDFIRETAPVFRRPTIEQLGEFIAPTWQALIDGARYVDERLAEIFDELAPDVDRRGQRLSASRRSRRAAGRGCGSSRATRSR